ncbi:hypothetical protein DXG01_014525 [Tephrocybe rancida]|nr:hypothetical protein DXG01_014525 [Tephrocybe rancida]
MLSFIDSPPDQNSPLYHTAPSSPLEFYTPPTSPLDDPSPPTPLQPPALHITIPTPQLLQQDSTDDPFPSTDIPVDLALDDGGLNTLEKIYLFARSKASFHRIYITHALPDLLHQVSPQEAIEYVLPLLEGLATDEDEQVKEALAVELVALIWWFFTHCDVTSDDDDDDSISTSTAVSVQAFTPILGTLLLSSNPLVGGAARHAIVDLLLRLRSADDRDAGTTMSTNDADQALFDIGSFDLLQREMVRTELLQQVVIGMGRLDMDNDDQPVQDELSECVEVSMQDVQQSSQGGVSSPRAGDVRVKPEIVNPYFPVMPPQFPASVSSPSSSTGSSPSLPASQSASLPPSSPSGHSTGTATTGSRKEPTPEPPESHHTQSDSSRQEPLDFARAMSPTRRPPGRAVPGGVSVTLSPTEETLAAAPQDPAADRRQAALADIGFHTPYDLRQDFQNSFSEDGEEDEQAAVGRLSSMSLIAAVTASGTLGEETKETFVREVVRVAQDSVYWVRREASFALGALAKVVPEEIVLGSLLPLFNTLRADKVWHVRHSALFALPAILSRLPASQRRSLAVETIVKLSTDESSTVQCGVLEALGEVLYTFHDDDTGPPEELVELFLGRREDRRVRDGQQLPGLLINSLERPLICAFNYPAVALTLGKERWGQLRDLYRELSENRGVKVRRSLAASLGELANIVGAENAQRDLIGVWWDGIRCEDEEVRTRAVESLSQLMGVVGTEVGDRLVLGLVTVCDEKMPRSWREREGIAQGLVAVAQNAGQKGRMLVVTLVLHALEDIVAAVREAGVRAVAGLWPILDPDALQQLRTDIGNLAQSPVFKQRMTFIACQHALVPVVPLDNTFFDPLLPLADDPVDAVRIRLARLVASIPSIPSPVFLSLTLRLSRDPSPNVNAYVLYPAHNRPSECFATFSRPPPTNNASKDRPVALVSVPSHPTPADADSSHDHLQPGHPLPAIPNTDIDTPSIVPVPA